MLLGGRGGGGGYTGPRVSCVLLGVRREAWGTLEGATYCQGVDGLEKFENN
jgi:hypothetical protein